MEHGAHYIWALLPILLFIFGVRAFLRRFSKLPLREGSMFYFKQSAFCTVILVVAIFLDNRFTDDFVNTVFMGSIPADIPRFVVYPALLMVAAKMQKFFTDRKEAAEKKERDKLKPLNARALELNR